jgi:hypothetical protein
MKSYRRGEGAYHFTGRAGLPSSADEGSSRLRDHMGEYVLAEAVLWQAIREYQQLSSFRTRREARLFQEVDQWFLENDEKWDFSFVNLCQILDLEPTCIRAALRMSRHRTGKQHEDVRFRTVQRKTVTRPRGRRQVGLRRAAGRDLADGRVVARGA